MTTLGEGGREPGVVSECGPYRAGDGLVHVVPDQVHQGEGSHAEPAGSGEHGVDVLRGGGVLLVDPPRLGVEGAGDPVDDEPRGGGGPDDGLSPRGGEVGGGVGDVRCGGEPGDDLDKLHGRDGVEEVQADEALGVGEAGGEGSWRQRGGVGREDGVVRDDRLKFVEQGPLDRQVLDDGLDHHFARGEAVRRVHGGQFEGVRVDAEASLGDLRLDAVADGVDGPLRRSRYRVRQQDPPSGDGRYLGNPGPHRAGTDNSNRSGAG